MGSSLNTFGFMNERKVEQEIDEWIGTVSAVMKALYLSIMVKKELRRNVSINLLFALI